MSKPSAKKIPPAQVEALFGIQKFKLMPIIENILQVGTISSMAIRVEYETTGSGMGSETCIPTFICQISSSEIREIRLFVKRQLHPDTQEVSCYLAAGKAGIPTPTYYGHRIGAEGEEILFLEFLPQCGIDDQNPAEVRDLVNLIACINTAPLRCDAFEIPAPRSKIEQVNAMHQGAVKCLFPKFREIWESALAGNVGAQMQALCRQHPRGIASLERYILRLHDRIAALPEDALVQGDTGPHQMGWRLTPMGRELVVFDLNWQVGRRFQDIGYIIHNYLSSSTLSQTEIAAYYLAAYEHWGGEAPSAQDFLEITRWLADEDKAWFCPWLWETALKQIAGGDPQVEANPNDFPAWLCQNLNELLEAAKSDKFG